MGSKETLSTYLDFLNSLPPAQRGLQPIGENNYFGPAYTCGSASTTSGYTSQTSRVPVDAPAVFEGTYLVIPEATWRVWNQAWAGVEDQLSGEAMDAAQATYGASSICAGTAEQQAAFLAWFIPQIRSTTWLWALGGLAAAAFAGGIVYTLKK